MSHFEPIQEESVGLSNFSKTYLTKLQKQDEENKEYKYKILKLLNDKEHSSFVTKQEYNFQTNFDRKKIVNVSDRENSLNSKELSIGFRQRQIKGAQKPRDNATNKKVPTEEQLCQILKIVKNKNKKTSIELMIKILHEIVCFPQYQQSHDISHGASLQQTKKKIKKSKEKNYDNNQNRFKNYEIRFNQYKDRVRKNYLPNSKLESMSSQVKREHDNQQQQTVSIRSLNQKFIQFSVPYHVIQYFQHKNSLAFRRQLDRESFQERRQMFKEFCLKGHTLPEYDLQRKTAKIFCLVGPGVRAARPFLGQDLGSHTHSKTISNIIKNTYRCLEEYINDHIYHFLKPNDFITPLQDSKLGKSQQINYPCYYASRKELSIIKTPLFNCRNWMNDEELELFLIFVKKTYWIKYQKEWEEKKINQIFLLFGRIIKKLIEKDILLRNLSVLKGNDILDHSQSKKASGSLSFNRV